MVMLSGGIVGADDEAGGTLMRDSGPAWRGRAPGYDKPGQDAVGALRRSADCGLQWPCLRRRRRAEAGAVGLVFDPLECGDEPMVHQRNIEVCVGVPHLFMAG